MSFCRRAFQCIEIHQDGSICVCCPAWNKFYMLGNIYFQRPEMAVNNGLIGDAFANLGWIGIIVMPLLIVITLKILDACSEGLDIKIFIMSAVTITFIFISSFYFTILMTHGLIAVCFILYLLPRDYELNRNEIGV